MTHSISTAINSHACALLERILWGIRQEELRSFEGAYIALCEEPSDDCAAIGFDVDEQLTVLEYYADDGFNGTVPFVELRGKLEEHAARTICRVALEGAQSALLELEALMQRAGFRFEDMVSENPFSWATHVGEREEGGCRVYEYRSVEGEVDVDVWECELEIGSKVYLLRWLNAEPDSTPPISGH